MDNINIEANNISPAIISMQ